MLLNDVTETIQGAAKLAACLFLTLQITVGRGLDVTYQLLSSSCPLMISRLHCAFKQKEDGLWTVTDKKVTKTL